MLGQIIKAYNEAVFDTDRERAMKVVHQAVDEGMSPEDVMFKVIIPAIDQMVLSISKHGDVNLTQHFMAAQISADATDEMIARMGTPPKVLGRVVIGTSMGDFHGLGKRIVSRCLRARMIDVIDLGLSVPPERFVNEAVARNAEVIAISSMMVHTAIGEDGCLRVRQILKERGLENKIKIIVGGVPYRFDHELYKLVQADAWAEDGITAGPVILDLIKEVRK
ncbi:MAG: cobalamin B12-binding domain-containing protein [Armatimonadota bacterium]